MPIKLTLRETALLTINEKVLPAYASLASKMSTLATEAPSQIGFGQFPGGKEFYDFTLNYYTSGNLTAEQIHQLGIDELARIHSEMRVLFDQLGYPQNETIAQLYARVDNDAELIPANQTKAVYESLIADAYLELPKLFNMLACARSCRDWWHFWWLLYCRLRRWFSPGCFLCKYFAKLSLHDNANIGLS